MTTKLPQPAGRLVSLDALRGFDMFWIIGADELFKSLEKISKSGPIHFLATQFEHVSWEGFRFYDLIFPLFVFIIGISLVFSLTKLLREQGIKAAYRRIFPRFALLFLLGVFYDEGYANIYDENVFCGVLQRLAWCYLFTSLLFCHFKWKGLFLWFAVILVGYWVLLSYVPVPDTGVTSYARDTNWTHYLDYRIPPYYDTDPEGFLSTLPAVGSCLLGVFAGFLLRDPRSTPWKKVCWLIAAGVAMVLLGYLWGYHFPIIKRLWTSSYVLVAGGYSCILLALFYLIVDLWGFQKWAQPLIWIGCNPLTIYLATNMFDFRKVAERFAGGDIAPLFGRYDDLLVTLVSLSMAIYLVHFLYKHKIFIRV